MGWNKGGRVKCPYSEGREIPETGCPTKSVTAMWRSLTKFFDFLIMSTLQNEVLLENIYEELMTELIDTGNLAMMSEDDINFEVNRRFQDISN